MYKDYIFGYSLYILTYYRKIKQVYNEKLISQLIF
nr:MAG TPA: protein of unknown function (DUF1774) [Myoviridae sp. ctNPX13]